MNIGRLVVVLLIAALIAGGVFYLTSRMQPTVAVQAGVNTTTVAPQVEGKQILVALTSVPAGTLIKQAAVSFAFRPWPASSVDDQAYVVEGAGAIEDFDGAVVRTGILAGEPVVKANVIKPGERGFLAAVLHEGMKAVSVSVNENTGVAGFVFPGDRVDLVLSHAVNLMHTDGETRAHNVSETILHDLRVVAVDQKSSDQEQVAAVSSVVTLEVDAAQSERIALAQRMGELRLVLRSMVVDSAGVSSTASGVETNAVVPAQSATDVLSETAPPVDASKDESGAGRTFTLDSDLSQIITPPGGDGDTSKGGAKIQVVRGSVSADAETK